MLLMHEVPDYKRYPNSQPSSQLANSFEGVSIDDDAPDELRRSAVNMFIAMFDLLEKTGYYDHTSDWDFHIGLELKDGSIIDHIGDGASIAWEGKADEAVYSGDDTRTHVRITAPRLNEPDEYAPLGKYYMGDEEEEWVIPLSVIRKLTFGYCT